MRHPAFRLSSDRIWKGIVAGFQATLSHLVGSTVSPIVPWALSFLHGSIVAGLLIGYAYRWLPGSNGVINGAVYGVLGWTIMGLAFFPTVGLRLISVVLVSAVARLQRRQGISGLTQTGTEWSRFFPSVYPLRVQTRIFPTFLLLLPIAMP